MEEELKRFVVWTYFPKDAYGVEPGWIVSGTFDDWESAANTWMITKDEPTAGPSYITEVCRLRVERVSVEDEAIFGKAIKPF